MSDEQRAAGGKWHVANQRYLMAAIARVRAAMEMHAQGKQADGTALESADAALAEAARAMPAPAALDVLCTGFGLSRFERDVLLLCAGPELAGGERRTPTFSLALAALPGAHWSALAPSSPLRRWHLVELSGDKVTEDRLRIDERVLHYLAGVEMLDGRLAPLVRPVPPACGLPPSQQDAARGAAEVWRRHRPGSFPPLIQLSGPDVAGRSWVAAEACALLGMKLHGLRAADLPAAAAERELLVRLWEREAVFHRSALLVDADDAAESERTRDTAAFVESAGTFVLLCRRDPLPLKRRAVVRFDVEKPGTAEQRDAWQQALGPAAAQLNGHIDRLVAQFNFSAPVIHELAAESRQSGVEGSRLWDSCRRQARPRLDELAQRLVTAVGSDDLVVPGEQRRTLREIGTQVRQRFCVYETWGFGARSARGLGISALFAGASGTGKTMAAEVLAGELRLDLYRIDLSAVVSKYIGETEKNLRRVFDAAEDTGAILLFDEADALFGKRSEVKDSHDRYANVEISYLLQRMESYRGLAILTTNMKTALDPAFMRRIRFVVQFPYPDAALRAEIWRRVFPAAAPTENLDPHKLGQLNVPGGNIRNIALNAAFLAAEAGEPVRMSHLLQAARSEYAKLERPLTNAETAGWV
jgi:hypothetical protein